MTASCILCTVGYAVATVVALAVLRNVVRSLTRGKYCAPSRITWKGTAFSWALWPETLLKRKAAFRPHTLAALQKAAMKNAKGLTDFGDTWYEKVFEHACGMVNARPLSPLGQHVAFDTMMRRLVTRLRFVNELKQLPAGDLEKPLLPPVFVLGLPRTGTTFLHHLLSLDDAHVRCPLTYELYDPSPQVRNDPAKDKKVRIKYVQHGIDTLKSIVPHIEAIHQIGATEPEVRTTAAAAAKSPRLHRTGTCVWAMAAPPRVPQTLPRSRILAVQPCVPPLVGACWCVFCAAGVLREHGHGLAAGARHHAGLHGAEAGALGVGLYPGLRQPPKGNHACAATRTHQIPAAYLILRFLCASAWFYPNLKRLVTSSLPRSVLFLSLSFAHLVSLSLSFYYSFSLPSAWPRQVLKLLSLQQASGDKRWVLKAPLHLGFVATIRKVFPAGTRFIWTHRDPRSSIPSLCSLFQVGLAGCERILGRRGRTRHAQQASHHESDPCEHAPALAVPL